MARRFCITLIVLPPKPAAIDYRTIGKALRVYRMWNCCRRPGVARWEGVNIAPWDRARPGSGTLDVAYGRAIQVEIASYNKQSYGVMLCDFTTCFVTLSIEHVVQEAVALIFPTHAAATAPRQLRSQCAGQGAMPHWSIPGANLSTPARSPKGHRKVTAR